MVEQKEAPTGLQFGKNTLMVVGGVLATAILASLVSTGIYAYNNPDPEKCWVIRDLESTAILRDEAIGTAQTLGIKIPEGYPFEMHSLFLKWFLWGFYSKLIISVLMVVTVGIYMASETVAMYTGGVSCGLFVLQYIIWLILGGVWRFSGAGVTASGDRLEKEEGVSDEEWAAQLESAKVRQGYQLSSGYFMKVYLYVALWTYSILLGLVIIAGVVMTCRGSSSKEDGEGGLDIEDKGRSERRQSRREKSGDERRRSKK